MEIIGSEQISEIMNVMIVHMTMRWAAPPGQRLKDYLWRHPGCDEWFSFGMLAGGRCDAHFEGRKGSHFHSAESHSERGKYQTCVSFIIIITFVCELTFRR